MSKYMYVLSLILSNTRSRQSSRTKEPNDATQLLELSLETVLHHHWLPKSKSINNIFLLFVSILNYHDRIMDVKSKFI